MDLSELRRRLEDILREEECSDTDWAAVERLCEDLDRDVAAHAGFECPHFVYHFTSDADIRAKDEVYGRHQRAEVRRFVDTGEYTESTPMSSWGCIGVIAALGALLFLLLR